MKQPPEWIGHLLEVAAVFGAIAVLVYAIVAIAITGGPP